MSSVDDLIFIDEEFLDRDSHVVATFEIEPAEEVSIEEVSRMIAYDPTIGTWTNIGGTSKETLTNEFSGKVLLPLPRANSKRGRVRIAFPLTVINPHLGGIPHLLAVLGAPFGLKRMKVLRLVDIQFPKAFVEAHNGPQFGLSGIYELINCEPKRPLLGTMLKPRSGLDAKAYAQMAYQATLGGVDIIFDDELMVSPQNAPFEERVPRVKEAIEEACQQTRAKKLYAVNITSSLRYIVEIALKAKSLGADILYFNPLAAGFSGLEILTSHPEIDLPILCCRSMHGVFNRGENGMDKYVLLKLARLAGSDGMHIGSVSGKLPHRIVGGEDEIKACVRALTSKGGKLKPMIPILSGGIHPGNLEWNVKHSGKQVILQAGSGVLGHPGGPQAGGKAMRDVIEAITNEKTTLEASKKSKDLRAALQKWGYVDQGEVKSV